MPGHRPPARRRGRAVCAHGDAGRRRIGRLACSASAESGLRVRTGDGEETTIGYDRQAGELYVDRTRSGRVDFNRDFPGVQRAPLTARDGNVHLRILVDWSSVEVFADRGQRVITDHVFPSATS